MKNPIHLALLFIILIGSDLFIGFISHYTGATDAEFSVETFMEYLVETNPTHWLLVFLIAIIVCGLVFFISGG